MLQGAQRRSINSANDAHEILAANFNAKTALGSLADTAGGHTTTAVFITIWQYWPGQGDDKDDIIVRSQIRFVQTPGNLRFCSASLMSSLHTAAAWVIIAFALHV